MELANSSLNLLPPAPFHCLRTTVYQMKQERERERKRKREGEGEEGGSWIGAEDGDESAERRE